MLIKYIEAKNIITNIAMVIIFAVAFYIISLFKGENFYFMTGGMLPIMLFQRSAGIDMFPNEMYVAPYSFNERKKLVRKCILTIFLLSTIFNVLFYISTELIYNRYSGVWEFTIRLVCIGIMIILISQNSIYFRIYSRKNVEKQSVTLLIKVLIEFVVFVVVTCMEEQDYAHMTLFILIFPVVCCIMEMLYARKHFDRIVDIIADYETKENWFA